MKAMPDFFIEKLGKFPIEELAEECFPAGIRDAGI